MEPIEIVLAVLNIIAVVLISIVAVIVGQKLQDRTEKRKDKLAVFKTLMANRLVWSPESVCALNIIEIVFADDKEVRNHWKDYYDKLCIQNPDEMQLRQKKLYRKSYLNQWQSLWDIKKR